MSTRVNFGKFLSRFVDDSTDAMFYATANRRLYAIEFAISAEKRQQGEARISCLLNSYSRFSLTLHEFQKPKG